MTDPSRRVPFRRRREGKTDYRQRRELIKSRRTRLVIRCTLSHTVTQFSGATPAGDRILVSAVSQELRRDHGWKAPCGNLPAAYLTGFIAGMRAKKAGLGEAVLDVGVKKPTPSSKVYASLKGVLDAGIAVPCNKETLPDESRIRGQHIADYWKKVTGMERRDPLFSRYLSSSLDPAGLPEHFDQVKKNIEKAFS